MSLVGSGDSAVVPLRFDCFVKNANNVNNGSAVVYDSHSGLWHANNGLLGSVGDAALVMDNLARLRTACGEHIRFQVANDTIFAEIQADLVTSHELLLQHYTELSLKSLSLPIDKIDPYEKLFSSQSVLSQLNSLASSSGVEIMVSKTALSFVPGTPAPPATGARNYYIYVLGQLDDAVFAETRLRIIIDDLANNTFIDSIEVPLTLIPMLGGVSFGNFKSIAKDSDVNIYLPSILPDLFTSSLGKKNHDLNTIYLSGLESSVMLAKATLMRIMNTTRETVYYKNVSVLKYKKDLLILSEKDAITSIMYKYGVFIKVPPLGSDSTTVEFYSSSEEIIELAIEEFIKLFNDIFVWDIWFSDLSQLAVDLSDLKNCFVYLDHKLKAVKFVGFKSDFLKLYNHLTQYEQSGAVRSRLSIELGSAFNEFISGKKNGKILKIMNENKCSKIDFKPLNEYNLVVELYSKNLVEFLSSFNKLQSEFPSEFRFFIPEAFHRQIIGTGGLLIQSVMRKYNVFVKFSNSFELKNNELNLVRFDNVIIRCPSKNASNIPLVQRELNELLTNNGENMVFFNTFVKLSRNQFNLFDFNKIQKIEKKTSTFIKFPAEQPLDFVNVEILGVESNSVNAATQLVDELNSDYEFKISFSNNFHNLLNDKNELFLNKIKIPFKLLFNFEIMTVDQKTKDSVPYHSILLTYREESSAHLQDVITTLTAFLRENELIIIDRDELSKDDLLISGSAPGSSSSHAAQPLKEKNQQQLYKLPNLSSAIAAATASSHHTTAVLSPSIKRHL